MKSPQPQMAVYRPDGEVLRRFIASKAPVKIIRGPIGSGKSLGCAMACYAKGLTQHKQKDGKRRCRIHVFRDRYPALEETTVKTWLQWFPEKEFGRFYWSKPFVHEIRLGDLELDVHFVALEDDRSVDFFRSLETTMCWFNEVQYMDRALFDEAVTRVGRYPRMIDGGPVGPQVIADMNAPSETHWTAIMNGDVPAPEWMSEDQRKALAKPEGWEFFVQPPGLLEERDDKGEVTGYADNPLAENVSYLPAGYYQNATKGKSKYWIDANVLNRVSPRREGKPVFKDFRRDVHVARSPLLAIGDLPLMIGLDFGRQPAAVIGQHLRGRWFILHELIGHDMGAAAFAPLLKAELAQRFPGRRFELWGDPSGDFKGQADETTPFMIFRAARMPIRPAPSNLLTIRLQAVEQVLTRMSEGYPCMNISPTCTTVVAGMDGGYHYRRLGVSGTERYSEEPEKDAYSHPMDALQYLLLGGGEGRILTMGGGEKPKPINTRSSYRPFAKSAGVRKW